MLTHLESINSIEKLLRLGMCATDDACSVYIVVCECYLHNICTHNQKEKKKGLLVGTVNNESRIEIENVRVRIVICFQQVRAYNPQLEKEATYLNVAVIDTLLL